MKVSGLKVYQLYLNDIKVSESMQILITSHVHTILAFFPV